jgi:hypothetical protein
MPPLLQRSDLGAQREAAAGSGQTALELASRPSRNLAVRCTSNLTSGRQRTVHRSRLVHVCRYRKLRTVPGALAAILRPFKRVTRRHNHPHLAREVQPSARRLQLSELNSARLRQLQTAGTPSVRRISVAHSATRVAHRRAIVARQSTWCINDQHPVRKACVGEHQAMCKAPCSSRAGAQLWQRSCTSWRCACQCHNEQQHSRRTVSMHEWCTHVSADRSLSSLPVHRCLLPCLSIRGWHAGRFILNGEFRFYGANIASKADELIATATTVARPILQSFTLNLVRLNETEAVAAVTPGPLNGHSHLVHRAHPACQTVSAQVFSSYNANTAFASCRAGRL